MKGTGAAEAEEVGAPGLWRQLGLATFRFGLSFHWQPINNVILQVQVVQLLGRQNQGKGIGLLFALGTVFAALVPPLVGGLSDRLSTRFGRRRPAMAVAVALNLVGLAVMLTAGTYPQLVAGYLIAQLANNGAGAAYSGLIPDSVPAPAFGRVSGLLATLSQVGMAAGLLGTFVLARLHQLTLMYAVIGAVLAVTLLPTLLAGRERPVAPARLEFGGRLARAVEAVRKTLLGDFGWVFLTRFFVTCGINAVSPFLLPFFRDVVGVRSPEQFTPIWLLAVIVVAVPCALAGGALSDRFGRKRFVYAAGLLQALVAVIFLALYPTQAGLVLAMAAAYGIGYGLFAAVDSALALDTLPDRARAARDLGVFHVAEVLPGVFVPAVGGFLLDLLDRQAAGSGYRFVFGGAALFFLLGGLLVRQVRSVR
jgi:MFS family permease